MNKYRKLGLAVVAAMASGRVPAMAQERGAAPLPDTAQAALVLIVFPDTAGAQQAVNSLNQTDAATAGHIQDYAVVSRDKNGKVHLQQSPTQGKQSAGNPRAKRAVNGVVARWVDSSGTAAGQSGISASSMNKMQNALQPGTSGIVAVTVEPYLPSVVNSLQQGKKTKVVEANLGGQRSQRGKKHGARHAAQADSTGAAVRSDSARSAAPHDSTNQSGR
jgi:uncharacterized membrane protein